MQRKTIFLGWLLLSCTLYAASPQNDSQPVNLITIPTAGVLPRGAYALDFRLFPNGGVWGEISVGVSDRFMFGVAYGGGNIIGDRKVTWYPQPGVEVKYRLIEESTKAPAVVLGFNSQGYGDYLDTLKRFETKAFGFYAVASKNYNLLGNLGLHAGINYNPLEKSDKDSDPNFFLGIDKEINSEISLLCEYNAAINDNRSHYSFSGKGKGYLNAGIRWQAVDKIFVEVDFNNLLLNRRQVDYLTRELKIVVTEYF